MKSKINFLKTALIVAVALFSFGNIQAQCDHTDDFESLSANNYLTTTTPNGWTGAVVSIGMSSDYLTFLSDCAYTLTYIASPVFNDGCSSISFKYKNDFDGSPNLKVEIKQDGTTVWSQIITDVPSEWAEFSIDNLNIKGAYQLVVTEIGDPSDDWAYTVVGIKDICLTNNTPVVNVQCDQTDDLGAIPEVWNLTSSITTPNGWTAKNAYSIDDSGIRYTGINGNTNTVGVLKSPVFSNGCKSLSFSWDNGMSIAMLVHFKVELQKEGTTVWSDEIQVENVPSLVEQKAVYNDLNIEGEVQLVITNLCPDQFQYQSTANVIELWNNFCLTDYTPEGNMGVENINAPAKISVYPNPFTDYLVVNTTTKGKAAIYNMSGQMVLSVNVQSGSNRIETSALPKGVYILRVGDKSVKIVK